MFLKFNKLIALFILYSLTLVLTYWIYINLFKVNVILYSSVLTVFLAIIPIVVLLFVINVNLFNQFEKFLICVLFILYGYAIAISLPTLIDRSLSFYLLEKINQRGGAVKQEAFEVIFKNEYVPEHRLIDIRLTEQLESGTITIENDCVWLTQKGKNLVHFSQFFRRNFLPNKRLIMGEYSDDLIDPLKQTNENKFTDGC
jgi:hypothetical protein